MRYGQASHRLGIVLFVPMILAKVERVGFFNKMHPWNDISSYLCWYSCVMQLSEGLIWSPNTLSPTLHMMYRFGICSAVAGFWVAVSFSPCPGCGLAFII